MLSKTRELVIVFLSLALIIAITADYGITALTDVIWTYSDPSYTVEETEFGDRDTVYVKVTDTQTKDGKRMIDYIAKDYESFRQAMIDLIPQKLPEWTDRSEADFGVVLIELFAYMADILGYYQDRIANESFLATAQERRSVIHHLRTIGYELAAPAPASALLSLIISSKKIQELTGAH